MPVLFFRSRRRDALVGGSLAAATFLFAPPCPAQTSSVSRQSPRDSVANVGTLTNTDSSLRVGLEPDALIYSVDRLPESVFQTARAVSVVSGSELRRRGARTLPEALMEEVGVFAQQTAYGHGAPIHARPDRQADSHSRQRSAAEQRHLSLRSESVSEHH